MTESTSESLLARYAGSLYTSGSYLEYDGRDGCDANDPLDCRLRARPPPPPPVPSLPVVGIGLALGVIPAVALMLSRLRRPSDVPDALLPVVGGAYTPALYDADRDIGGAGYVTPLGTGEGA